MTGTVLLAVLLGTVLPVWGQTARRPLDWDYNRALVPPVKGFGLVAVDGRGGIQQFQVSPSEPGACDGAVNATEATFCATVACPAGGNITAYWVQAITATDSSPPSNILTCWTPPNTPACPCLDPSAAPPGQGLPPSTPPVMQPPAQLPPLSPDPPPLPQRSAEGLNLQPIGPLPELASIPAIPASGGT